MATESSVMAVIRASRPSLRTPHDKIAFAVHSAFLAAGYSLIAAGRNAFVDAPPTDGEEVGIEGWNELEDSYGFVYSKGSKKAVLVKGLAIGDVLAIDVVNLKEEQKEPFNLQINVRDYLVDNAGNYGEMFKNLPGLVENLNSGFFAKLEPKEEPKAESSSSARSAERSERSSINAPDVGVPSVRQPRSPGIAYPPIPGFGGNQDLYPGPGAGFYPDRGLGFDGGMLVGPNDPRWFGSDERARFPGGIPGVPPGARFDPYGPPDVPGFEPNRFVRQPPRRGGGTHPDLEHFQGPDYI